MLLLDEPLVNLDYKLREELRIELQEIFEQREAIVVYTTTEPTEALMLGGKVVVIDEGRVLQTGVTPEVYHNPATTKVAEVFSDPPINYLVCSVQQRGASLGGDIEFPLSGHLKSLPAAQYIFGIRSNHLSLNRTSAQDAELRANVTLSEINGSETFIHVNYDNSQLVLQEDGIHPHRIGTEISIYVNPSNFFVFDEAGALVASPIRKTARNWSKKRNKKSFYSRIRYFCPKVPNCIPWKLPPKTYSKADSRFVSERSNRLMKKPCAVFSIAFRTRLSCAAFCSPFPPCPTIKCRNMSM